MKDVLSLLQLNNKIKEIIQDNFSTTFLVVAEISELKVNRNGHCYLELIQKKEEDDAIVAKANATIWAYTFRMLKAYFETETGQELRAGMKILVSVTVEYHELYGFSLNIKDIDPSYTIGDMEKKKQEIIRTLKAQGVLEMNKEIPEPLVYQKLAIISSPTAAGYGDFIKQLKENRYGYCYYMKLFPAFMQGEKTESSIIAALDKIYAYEDFFDCVIIIRGGGSQHDLHSFNSYNLAYHITQFPLPVLCGIGHDKDSTITDMVVHTSLKTPTAVAEFIVQKMLQFEEYLREIQSDCVSEISAVLAQNKLHIENILHTFHMQLKERLMAEKTQMIRHSEKIKYTVQNLIFTQQKRLEMTENTLHHVNPLTILKKGYSITTCQRKVVKDAKDTTVGDMIETLFYHGKRKSIIME